MIYVCIYYYICLSSVRSNNNYEIITVIRFSKESVRECTGEILCIANYSNTFTFSNTLYIMFHNYTNYFFSMSHTLPCCPIKSRHSLEINVSRNIKYWLCIKRWLLTVQKVYRRSVVVLILKVRLFSFLFVVVITS